MFIFGILFLASVLLLLIATHFTILLSEKLSRVWRISPLIVATTIVAVGTSLPELVLSLAAIATGDRGLALGNVVGSNVINVLLVLPIALLVGKIRVGTNKTQKNALVMLGATVLFILFQTLHFPNVISGFVFLIAAFLITIYEYRLGLLGRLKEDLEMFIDIKQESFTRTHGAALFVAIVWVIMSGVTIVYTVENISELTGLSTTVLGLTLTAIATSLPELMVTISNRDKKREKLVLGNILGSNIYNLLLVAGLINIMSQNYVTLRIEWLYLAITTGIFFAIIVWFKGRAIRRSLAGILLIGFLLYIWSFFL